MKLHQTDTNEDIGLLQQLKEDSKPAFDTLYQKHWLSLYNIAYKRLRDREVSKDVVQDVFADLWDKRRTKDIEKLLPYLHTAVRYKIYTLLSKGQATAHFIEPFEAMAISSLTADGHLEEQELTRIIGRWMQTLPQKKREIFRLKFIDGLSTKEISEQLNISQKTVQNQVLSASAGLRLHISKYLLIVFIVLYNF